MYSVWSQAEKSNAKYLPLDSYGWIIENQILKVKWDTAENISQVTNLVKQLTSGCGCKKGCKTKRCKCYQSNHICSVSCKCVSCENLPQSQTCSQSAHVSTSQIPSLCTNQTTNNIESSTTDMSSTESHVVFEKGVSDSESESDGDSDSEEFEDAYDAYDFDNLDQIDTSKRLKADDLSYACASDTESDLSEIESY